MPAIVEHDVVVGPFRLNPRTRILSRDGAPVSIGGRAIDILLVLAASAGETVTKDALLEQVWPGSIVEENNLQVQMSSLRKVLGEGRIATIPGRGYRLLAPAKPVVETPPDAITGKPSIAILPFVNMSDDSEQEYFADGMGQEIITMLSRIRSLFVIARSSSFSYKNRPVDVRQVGRELNVRYVVEGSVRRGGNRIRVAAQLVDAESGSQIWAARFDRDAADLFSIQEEITQALVEAFAPAISQAERQRAMKRSSENIGAWEMYQRALWHWSKQRTESLTTARDLLQQAVALDAQFGQPHAVLAWLSLSESTLGLGSPLQESAKFAETKARTAVALEPDNAMGHAMLAWAFDHQGQFGPALEEAELAVRLNPNDPWGQMAKGRILVISGRVAESREPLAAALRLDPHGPTASAVMHHLGLGCYFDGDYLGAVALTRRTIRDFPSFPRPHPVLVAALGQLGWKEEARAALEAALTASRSYFELAAGSRRVYFRPQDHEHLLFGIRKAGWKC
jgi:adenylate cyclase